MYGPAVLVDALEFRNSSDDFSLLVLEDSVSSGEASKWRVTSSYRRRENGIGLLPGTMQLRLALDDESFKLVLMLDEGVTPGDFLRILVRTPCPHMGRVTSPSLVANAG
jgi:hypothetical protein